MTWEPGMTAEEALRRDEEAARRETECEPEPGSIAEALAEDEAAAQDTDEENA